LEEASASADGDGSGRDPHFRRLAEFQAAREAELQRRALLRQLLEPSAYERLSNIRLSNPDLYLKLSSLVGMLYQRGELRGKVSEELLKALAGRLLAGRREVSIRRESK